MWRWHSSTAPMWNRTTTSPAGFRGIGALGFGDGNNRMARLANGIEIVGPFNSTGVSQTASRALIFVCDPQKIGEPACAKQITANLARRAFRRPVTADDVASLMPFYEAGREGGGSFDDGIEQVVAAVLASPDFLYRAIRGPEGTRLPTPSLLSPTWNWLPAFRSSCGIPARMRNC